MLESEIIETLLDGRRVYEDGEPSPDTRQNEGDVRHVDELYDLLNEIYKPIKRPCKHIRSGEYRPFHVASSWLWTVYECPYCGHWWAIPKRENIERWAETIAKVILTDYDDDNGVWVEKPIPKRKKRGR